MLTECFFPSPGFPSDKACGVFSAAGFGSAPLSARHSTVLSNGMRSAIRKTRRVALGVASRVLDP